MALSPSGEIYVTDGYGNARVHKFTPDGTLLFSWGAPGDAPIQFRLPHSLWVDKQERVWVVDRENNRIQIFNAQGEFLSQWTDFIRPTDIVIDDKETVYISELGLRVHIFTIDGKLLARIGRQGQEKGTDLFAAGGKLQARWGGEGQDKGAAIFLAPHAIAVDSRSDIYVGEVSMTAAGVDRGVRTVQKFARVT